MLVLASVKKQVFGLEYLEGKKSNIHTYIYIKNQNRYQCMSIHMYIQINNHKLKDIRKAGFKIQGIVFRKNVTSKLSFPEIAKLIPCLFLKL